MLVVVALARAGRPQGIKAVVYVWVLALFVLLPVSLGVNLWRPVVPWRLFAGGWLLVLGVLNLGGIRWVAPEYQVMHPSTLCVCGPGLAGVVGGLLLLLTRQRS